MTLDTCRLGLSRSIRFCLGLLIIALIGLEVAQVVLRYFLATGVSWGRDVSTLMMFAIAWLGAPLLWLDRRHLAVDLLPDAIGQSRAWNAALDLLVMAAALALLIVTRTAMGNFAFIDLPALGTSAAIKFWPMSVGAGLLLLAGALNLLSSRNAP